LLLLLLLIVADEEKQNECPAKEEKRREWLNAHGMERRRPENAFIRRWFKLADSVLGRKDDSDKSET